MRRSSRASASVGVTDNMETSPEDGRKTSTVAVKSDEVGRGVAGRGGTLLECVVGQDNGHSGGEVTSCGFSVVHPWSRDRIRTDVRNVPVRVNQLDSKVGMHFWSSR